MRKYPRIVSTNARKKNISAKCKCGEVGKFRPEIQVSYMRGDDVVLWACDVHKMDHGYLLSSDSK